MTIATNFGPSSTKQFKRSIVTATACDSDKSDKSEVLLSVNENVTIEMKVSFIFSDEIATYLECESTVVLGECQDIEYVCPTIKIWILHPQTPVIFMSFIKLTFHGRHRIIIVTSSQLKQPLIN
jgi:hypothetical protein